MIQAPPFLGEQHAPYCVCSFCAPYGTREARKLARLRHDLREYIQSLHESPEWMVDAQNVIDDLEHIIGEDDTNV